MMSLGGVKHHVTQIKTLPICPFQKKKNILLPVRES